MLEEALFSAGVKVRHRLVDDLVVGLCFLWLTATMAGILLRFRPGPSVGGFSLPVAGSRVAARPRVAVRPRVVAWPFDLEDLALPPSALPFRPAALFASVKEHLSLAL